MTKGTETLGGMGHIKHGKMQIAWVGTDKPKAPSKASEEQNLRTMGIFKSN